MDVLKLVVFHIVLLVLTATSVSGKEIRFVHQGIGTGSINGVLFGESAFSIYAQGDTNNRFSDGSDVDSIPHYHASIVIDGVGAFAFVSPTRTFVNRSVPIVGFSRYWGGASGPDLFDGPSNLALSGWSMISSIGPISGIGSHADWGNFPTYHSVSTTGGDLYFDFSSNVSTTFTATIIPEPATLSLLLTPVLFCGLRRNRKL